MAVAALVFVLFVVRVGQAAYERLRPSEAVEARPVAVEVLRVEPGTFEYTVPIAGTTTWWLVASTGRTSTSRASDFGGRRLALGRFLIQ